MIRNTWVGLALLVLLVPGRAATGELPSEAAISGVRLVDALPMGPSVEERLAEIRRRIQAAVVYPASARRRGLVGVSEVRFEIGVDGRAEAIRVVHSSGHPILDRAAARGVAAAGVLPRVYGRLQVPVRFGLEPR